jgi:hypothetical protein
VSEGDKREHFSIPRDPQAPEQASGSQQATGQQSGDGARGEQGNGQAGGQAGGQQQTATREEPRERVEGVGEVVEIKGVVVDVRFNEEEIPEIFNALKVEIEGENGESGEVTLEVQQIVGDDVVRTVAMGSTDGMSRGLEARDTGQRTITGPYTARPRRSRASPPSPSSS